jgi:hypothetical protein
MSLVLKEGQIFVKKKHELADLAKQLGKITPAAIELMASKMEDDDVPLKERLKLAESIVDLKIRITDQINKDELNRLIAEIRANGPKTPLIPGDPDGEKKPGAPRLDMHTIQEA